MSRIDEYVNKDGDVDLDSMYADAIVDLAVVIRAYADADVDVDLGDDADYNEIDAATLEAEDNHLALVVQAINTMLIS